MDSGVVVHKQERVYSGNDYYLISLSSIQKDGIVKYYVTVMLNGVDDRGAEKLDSMDTALEAYEKTLEKFRNIKE